MKKSRSSENIKDWIFRSFINSIRVFAIIFVIIFMLLIILNRTFVVRTMSEILQNQVQEELSKATNQDAKNIDQQLIDINYLVEVYALQTAEALEATSQLSKEDEERLAYSTSGVYYTTADLEEGGAAVFYSGYYTVGETERMKVSSLLKTQSLMADIQQSQPLIVQIYLNTYDSLNIIYPYFDVISQYPEKMDIPQYNFYYEADSEHNPDRSTEWTDVYLDPAGYGWMASCIAPVYSGDFLEGVVGVDVTISTITEQVLNLDIPWNGYAMLIGSDGTILALPESGEEDWGLSELTDYPYSQAIMQDTFKPSEFNLNNMSELSGFAEETASSNSGLSSITLNGEKKVVSWETISETGWRLLFIVPEDTIYFGINQIKANEILFGFMMIASMLVIYMVFSILLKKVLGGLSATISDPLINIDNMVSRIGAGEYYQESANYEIDEFQNTTDNIVKMGNELGKYNQELLDTQEAIKTREAYLQALVNSIDDAIFEVDDNGNVTNFRTNDPRIFARVFPQNINGSTTLDSFLSKSESQQYLEVVRNVIDTGKTASVEYSTETDSGTRWFLARVALIGNNSRKVAVSLRDITVQKKLEKSIAESRNEAEKASQAKSEFLSNMSHELRTPLNAVLGFAQILEIDPEYPLSESQKDSINEIKKAGKHLLDLINEVLDLAKIESGRMTISIEPVSVANIVDETFALVKPLAEKFGIELVSNYKRCERYVNTDKIRIKQILINLISNAIKYNKENGSVTFYCESYNDKIRFHVEDTGVGIPKDQMDEIFKPFNRLNSTKNLVEGTGIGLAMVKQLSDLMGGRVHVESELGEGSHFYVEIPEASIDKPDLEGIRHDLSITEFKKNGTQKNKVLYVEDNPANLNLVQRIISYVADIELLSATSAQVGIDIAISHCPDLILLDINLPDMDGYEAFRKLKGLSETKDIPIIAVSANAMEKDIRYALDLGFDDYFTKPIDVPIFISKLKDILG